MADSGFLVPGTVVSAGSWVSFDTTRLASADDSRANTGVGTDTYVVGTLCNFGFSIPTGATINGIEIQTELSPSNGGDTATARSALSHNAGTNYTAYSALITKTGTSVDEIKTMGSSSDTWGRTWTAAEINDNTNFYVKIEGKNSTGGARNSRIDYLWVKVYYTEVTGIPHKIYQKMQAVNRASTY